MLQKSSFNPKHDLREKCLDSTFKVHKTSALNPFWSSVTFLYPLKTSETFGFLTFSGGIEMWHWNKIWVKVLTGTKILSTVLWLFLTFFAGWIFVVSLSFSCVRLAKKCCPNIRATRDLNFWFFYPWRMIGQTGNTHFWYIETFWGKLQYDCHLLCVLLSNSENMLSLNQTSLNIYLFLVFTLVISY